MYYRYKKSPHAARGFSLVEVLITSAIIGIITAIVVVKYGAFNSSILLRNQAYEIALAIRQAQVFSISVRSDTTDFRDEYGIHVALVDGKAQLVTLFVDSVTDNDAYDGPGSGEEVEELYLDSRFEIYELCVWNTLPKACAGVDDLSVVFKRPDFDAKISSSDVSAGAEQVNGEIHIQGTNSSSVTRTIFINGTGQVSVQ